MSSIVKISKLDLHDINFAGVFLPIYHYVICFHIWTTSGVVQERFAQIHWYEQYRDRVAPQGPAVCLSVFAS